MNSASMSINLEECFVLTDIQEYVSMYGEPITLQVVLETAITRSRYGDIKVNTSSPAEYTVYAYPLEFDPTEKQLEKAGIKEEVNAIAWTATKDWTDNNISFLDADVIRHKVVIDGHTYSIKTKGRSAQIRAIRGYIILGLNKV